MNSTVYVVDDDGTVRESLRMMIAAAGFAVQSFASAEEFLDAYRESGRRPCCLVLDVCMPGLSGLGLQAALSAVGLPIPIVMMSGCADIPGTVQAMRAGAVDFLEKPFGRSEILDAVRKAVDMDIRQLRAEDERALTTARLNSLTMRQREVMRLLIDGKQSKQIALILNIGEQTVAKHRALVLEKMGVQNVAELVRLVERFPGSHPSAISA
jgi:FixJ family two-component response regulator